MSYMKLYCRLLWMWKKTYVRKANSARPDKTKSNLRLHAAVFIIIGQSDWSAYVTWPTTRRPIRIRHLASAIRRQGDVTVGILWWRHWRWRHCWCHVARVTFSRKRNECTLRNPDYFLPRDAMLARYMLLSCLSVCHKLEFYKEV